VSELIDSFGRLHDNLRVSVTDRCNLRCTYCMPEEVEFLGRSELLSFEEIERFVRIAVSLGVTKLRLTGGEPLMRRGIADLVRKLTHIEGIRDVALTTNGLLLAEHARSLREAGLHRLNVSLDTLDPDKFRQITRRDGLDRVVAGILAARDTGFASIKVNAVAIRGFTEDEIAPLGRFARTHGLEMRFIEYMPIGADQWQRDKVLFAHDILDALERAFGPLVPADDYDPRAPAMEFRYLDGHGKVGIVASVSRPFCSRCNRLRLTSDGKLRNCLFALDETDVKSLLRSGTPDVDARIADAIRASVWAKWEGHEINTARFLKPLRTMHAIGG
jgi:cyclic pyranopterin phosphate synthase